MRFKIGERVVCVKPREGLVKGNIYTIRGYPNRMCFCCGTPVVVLEEIIRDEVPDIGELAFHEWRFAPIVTKKTDISVFTEILDKAKAPGPKEKVKEPEKVQ